MRNMVGVLAPVSVCLSWRSRARASFVRCRVRRQKTGDPARRGDQSRVVQSSRPLHYRRKGESGKVTLGTWNSPAQRAFGGWAGPEISQVGGEVHCGRRSRQRRFETGHRQIGHAADGRKMVAGSSASE